MARTIRNVKIDTRSARVKLETRREPYWTVVTQGRAVGYRRGKKGGTWIARFRDVGGKQLYLALGAADDTMDADGAQVLDFAQAQKLAREWFEAIARTAAGGNIAAGPYTVGDALTDYMGWFRAHRKSIRETESAIESRVRPKLGQLEVRNLTAAQVRDWHRDLATTPARLRSGRGRQQRYRPSDEDPDTARRRRSTANRLLTVLKAALNHAWQEGRVESDAAWRRIKPFPQADAAKARYLSQAECKRLVNASAPDFRLLVQAALLTGCRYGELAGFRVADFNADAGTLHVQASKAGKPRHVVLTEDGQTFFQEITAGRGADEALLQRAAGRPWGKSHQTRPLLEACKVAKITPPASFHILRHTYASHLVMSGVPMPVVAANLGHTDTRMVEKHYAHLAPSYVADTIRATAPTLGIVEKSKLVPIDGQRS
jgi:integrase